MAYNVVVAEPSDEVWTSIAHGVRRYQPEAAVLRVKDGEQALRFLFHRGLLTEEPETPHLIVLNAELPIVPLNMLIDRLRQHPRTRMIPLLVVRQDSGSDDRDAPIASHQWLHRLPGVITITGTKKLESEVANAAHRLSTAEASHNEVT